MKNMKKTKVVHIMADGTVRDSVAGIKIPITNKIAYSILAKYAEKKDEKRTEDSA